VTDKIAVDAKAAAELLDMGESTFLRDVAPFILACNLAVPSARKRMPRWLVVDLIAFAQSRKGAA